MTNYGRELLKGSTDAILLYLINAEPMYGYQMIKVLETRTKGYFQFKEGTLYPALHRLEKAGFIKGKWEKLSNGQERRYYYITEKGQNALSERVETWRGFSQAVNLVIQPSAN
jgi:PadR family transcriptional regulator, regulatory protein PadR